MREIITEKKLNEMRRKMGKEGQEMKAPQIPDEYLSKVLKLIPAEVVSLYVALAALIGVSGESVNEYAFWFIFIVCLIGTPLYLWKITKVSDFLQVGISTLAFVVWVITLGASPLTKAIPGFEPVYGGVLLLVFTFFIPFFMPQ
jgi:hypothetical protein